MDDIERGEERSVAAEDDLKMKQTQESCGGGAYVDVEDQTVSDECRIGCSYVIWFRCWPR
jgi:hypothetical protein